jgi:hypothetical protein
MRRKVFFTVLEIVINAAALKRSLISSALNVKKVW